MTHKLDMDWLEGQLHSFDLATAMIPSHDSCGCRSLWKKIVSGSLLCLFIEGHFLVWALIQRSLEVILRHSLSIWRQGKALLVTKFDYGIISDPFYWFLIIKMSHYLLFTSTGIIRRQCSLDRLFMCWGGSSWPTTGTIVFNEEKLLPGTCIKHHWTARLCCDPLLPSALFHSWRDPFDWLLWQIVPRGTEGEGEKEKGRSTEVKWQLSQEVTEETTWRMVCIMNTSQAFL